MPEQLIEGLIHGPARRRLLAWTQLTAGGQAYTRCCHRIDPDRGGMEAVAILQRCFDRLSEACQPGNPHDVLQLIGRLSGSRPEAERLVGQLQRLLAAAVLAARIRRQDTEGTELGQWARRAACLPGAAFAAPRTTGAEELFRRTFGQLVGEAREAGRLRELAAARTAVLEFLHLARRSHSIANVPVLTVLRGSTPEEGRVLYLSLDLLPRGYGVVFPRMHLFRPFDEDWWTALDEAVAREQACFAGYDVCWDIQGSRRPPQRRRQVSRRRRYHAASSPPPDNQEAFTPLGGCSAQAAFQVALRVLGERGLYDRRYAVTAEVDAAGELRSVYGVVADHHEAGPKLVAARETDDLACVLVAENDYRALSPAARERLDPLQIRQATRLEDVYAQVSGQTNAARAYLQHLASVLEGEEAQRYVEPDVEHLAAGQPVRVPWKATFHDLGRNPVPLRGLVIGAPGQGKTTLARRTVAGVAVESRDRLNAGEPLAAVRWPALIPIDVLAAAWAGAAGLQPADRFQAALAEVLAATLRECPGADPASAQELAGRIAPLRVAATLGQSPGLLILDAYDEVAPSRRHEAADLLEAAAALRCHVVVTSRPYAVEDRLRAGGWTIYTLAPFSDQQLQEYFRVCCGREPPAEMLSQRLCEELGRTPFLLDLLATSLAGAPGSTVTRRSDLFGRVILGMLGQVLTDPRAAGAWLPLLGELALQTLEKLLDRGLTLPRAEVLALFHQSRFLPPGLASTPGEAAEQALNVLERARLFYPLDSSRDRLGFDHRLLLEYLAACGLQDALAAHDRAVLLWRAWSRLRGRSPWRFLNRKAWDPRWEEIILFLAELLPPAAAARLGVRLARRRADDLFGHRLALAVRCLAAASVPDRVGAGGWAFVLWWRHARRGTTAAVERLTEALPAAARLAPVVRGCPLGLWLRQQLTGPDAVARRCAAEAIGLLGPEADRLELLLPLVEQLTQRPEELAQPVAASLRRLGRTAATPPVLERLAALLVDERPEVRTAAVLAVRALGPAAGTRAFLDRLRQLLSLDESPHLLTALGVVGALAEEGTNLVETLHRLFGGNRPAEVQAAALGAFAELAPFLRAGRGTLNKLSGCLNPDRFPPVVRTGAIHAIQAGGPGAAREGTLDKLLPLLGDADAGVRKAAADALRDVGLTAKRRHKVLQRLAEALGEGSGSRRGKRRKKSTAAGGEVWLRAAEVAACLGRAVADPDLIQALAGGLNAAEDLPRRQVSARALAEVGPDPAGQRLPLLERLLPLLTDPDPEVRAAVIRATGRYLVAAGDPGAVRESLDGAAQRLRDADPGQRAAAARALLRQRLRQLLESQDPAQLQVAAELIGTLGPPRGSLRLSRELLDLLDNRSPDVVRAAWQAIAARGDWRDEPDRRGRFFDRLVAHLSPQHPALHRAALEAMEYLAPDPRRSDVLIACCRLLDTSPDREVRATAARALREWMRLGIRFLPVRAPWSWLAIRARATVRSVQELSQGRS